MTSRKKGKVVINDDTDAYLGEIHHFDNVEDAIKDLGLEDEETIVAQPQPETYNTVRLVNRIGARVRQVGPVTGKQYYWSQAGAVVEVDERDAPELLKRRLGNRPNCCNGENKNYVFEIME